MQDWASYRAKTEILLENKDKISKLDRYRAKILISLRNTKEIWINLNTPMSAATLVCAPERDYFGLLKFDV